MAVERTLSIIKPDGVQNGHIGDVISKLEKAGFKIVAQRMVKLTKANAEKFYEVHKERPFYGELVEYMTSGRVVVMVLEAENAVAAYREIMGATDPNEAKEGTIRREFAESKGRNCVHGSDSLENAKKEISFFFPEVMIF